MVRAIQPIFSLTVGNAELNTYHSNKGEGLPKHEHVFPHLTMCHAGSISVAKQGKKITLKKEDQPVLLAENEWHEIQALEDNTVFVNVRAAL